MSSGMAASAWLNALRDRVRRYLYARATTRVLVLGDSHVRVFEHWSFLWRLPRTAFEIVYVPGATAGGIGNRHSVTNAYHVFVQALQQTRCDLVLVNLGEVDTAYTLWRKIERDGGDARTMADRAIRGYCAFLEEVSQTHRLAVMAACLPTLADQASPGDEVARVRQVIDTPQAERTQLALYFNRQVAAFCADKGIVFLDSDAAALGVDGLVRADWINQNFYDHHYARAPYARWLASALRCRIKM